MMGNDKKDPLMSYAFQHNTLFVFDIETVPDTEAVYNLTGVQSNDPAELKAALDQYHLEITDGKNAFPRQMFHKVVAISFVEAEIDREGGEEIFQFKHVMSGRDERAPEKELIEAFCNFIQRKKPRLVSFNGRGFDLPVLKFRAMKYGLSVPALYQSGDKWNNYGSRYSADWHCDLLDVLSDYGAATRGMKLNELCAVFGFPGKLGIDGSKVADMYEAGQIKEIRDYCETDVLNTYLVYLRYQLLTGGITKPSYNAAVSQVVTYIEAESKERAHLAEFMAAWGESSGNKFLLD